MKKIIILIFALVFSLFLPSAFAFSQSETLEYYQENYFTQEIESPSYQTIMVEYPLEIEKIDMNNTDIYFNDTLIFTDLSNVNTDYYIVSYISEFDALTFLIDGTAYELKMLNLSNSNENQPAYRYTNKNADLSGSFTFVDKSKIIAPPLIPSLFDTISDIIIGFGSLLGALFVLIASIFYNESLTIVGILALLGVGLSLTYWGFRTVLRLLKIKRE